MLKDFWLDDNEIIKAQADMQKGDYTAAIKKITEVDPNEEISLKDATELYAEKSYYFVRNLEKKYPDAKITKKLFHLDSKNIAAPNNKKLFAQSDSEILDKSLREDFAALQKLFAQVSAGNTIILTSQQGESFHKSLKSVCAHLIKEYHIDSAGNERAE